MIKDLFLVTLFSPPRFSISGIPESEKDISIFEVFLSRSEATTWADSQSLPFKINKLNLKKIVSFQYYSGNQFASVILMTPGTVMNGFKPFPKDYQIRSFDGSIKTAKIMASEISFIESTVKQKEGQ